MNNIYYTLLSHVSQFGLQGVLTSVLISSTNNSNEVVDAFAFINTPPPHTHTKMHKDKNYSLTYQHVH